MPPPFYLCFATSVAVTRAPHVFRPSTENQFTWRPSTASLLRRARLHNTAAASRIPHATAAAATIVSNNSENKNNNNGASDSDDVPPVVTAQVTNSALGTLLSYISELSKQQPFIRRRLILSLMCILASKLIGVTVPFFFKQTVDALMLASSSSGVAAATSKATRAAIVAILLHGVTRLLASITHELRSVVFAKGGQRVGRSATATAFAHLHSLEVAFHTGSHTGAVTRVIDRGTRAIMTIFRAMVFSFFPSFFELVLVCTVLFTKFSAAYAAITLLTFATFTTWTLSINNNMSRIRQRLNSAENEASAKLTDSLLNVEAVKVYDNARHETKRYDKSLEKFEAISIQNEKLFASLNIGQTAAYTAGLTALLLLATTDVAAGRITVGSVVLLTTMLQRLWIPLDFLGWQYREVKQSIIDVQNLFDILRREPAVKDRADTTPLIVTEGHINFQNVCFSYPAGDAALPFASKKAQPVKKEPGTYAMNANGKDKHFNNGVASANSNGTSHAQSQPPAKRTRRRVAIDNLSFSVPGGTSVALVGASGSGKSTATRLLCRLYDVTGGNILIDGQDIAFTSLSSLRKAVSIVPQDTALFNDTVAYNIRYGRPSATDEEVVEAAKAASIHDVIMRTEHGYNTLVGERGVKLSGGERQRLSVARAFLKGSRIIIEDESTSALDTLTEMEVSKSLQELGMNRTRIIVAHRLSTIMNVDQVIVMKSGRLVEQGTFDDLVSRPDGIFRDMWQRQQRKEENNNDDDESMEDDEDSMLFNDHEDDHGGADGSADIAGAGNGGAGSDADGRAWHGYDRRGSYDIIREPDTRS